MNAVKNTRGTSARAPGALYAKVLALHERHARELAAAQNRWQKSRAALARLEKKLDRLWATQQEEAKLAVEQADPFNDTL